MSIYHELDHLGLDELIKQFYGSPPDGNEYAFVYYSDVASLILSKGGQIGTDFLRAQLNKDEPERLRAILSVLAPVLLNDSTFKALLVSLLKSKDPLLVMEAIDSLRLQDDKSALNGILPLRSHYSPYVRGAVLRFVRQLFPHLSLSMLVESTHDEHYIVREVAADELGELGEADALPHLQELLTDSSPQVQQAARTAIEWLQSK